MQYGTGAGVSVAGVAVLPFTGNNTALLIVAGSMIAAGIVVLVVSMLLGRKNSKAEA